MTKTQKAKLFETMTSKVSSSSKSQSPSHLLTKSDVKGLDLVDLVQKAVKEKKMVPWGVAHMVANQTDQISEMFSDKFRQSDCGTLTVAFNAIEEGADALLVNKQGCYGKSAPVEKHRGWLAERGYDVKVEQTVSQGIAALG